VDLAYRYQGRKYDLTPAAQPREFPRIAYDVPAYGWPAAAGVAVINGQVWDVAADGSIVVPARVLQAVVYEADAVLAGDKFKAVKDAIAAGLSAQSFGGMSESYRADGTTPLLCRFADTRMRFYMLRQGRIL
jgi:hypothetical protein